MKYTKEVLEIPVRESHSIAEVLRRLGVKQSGGMQSHIKRCIGKLGLDTSHFLGQRRNQGETHRGGPEKLSWAQVLVVDRHHGRREKTDALRQAMAESGIPYRCAICSSWPVWMGQVLILQIDHINGDPLDNRRENLRFLCPNCHSQTETFGGKNKGRLTELEIDEIYMWAGDGNLADLSDSASEACEFEAHPAYQ